MTSHTTTLLKRLRDVFRAGEVRGRILLAVSGGADSIALLRATQLIAAEVGLEPIVAHFDHGLRPESAADAAWVAEQAGCWNLPLIVGRSEDAEPQITSTHIEEAARRRRYDFLIRAATAHRAAWVATAHTADDQAETVLFQLLRGTGLRGLRGIPRRRPLAPGLQVVRPFLDWTRAEIESLLADLGQPYRTDGSNADLAFTRNRIRHELLPQLREQFNPRIDQALRRLARQADDVSVLLGRSARRELRLAQLELGEERIRLRLRRLKQRPRAVIRETIALAWRRARWPRQSMGFDHWDRLAELALSGGRRSCPAGVDARRRQGELILERRPR